MTRSPATPVRRAAAGALLLGFALVTACGRGPNQSADRNGADTTSADRSALGQPVSAGGAANDSAFAKASGRLDSLSDAGVTANDGINTVPAKVQNQTANEPIRDTSRLNNRGPAPGQPAAGERRP